jgi:glycerol-3-phosphate acyltransferase PlsX
MLGAMLAMLPALKKFSAKLDPRKVNGAVFLGLNGVVVKSHGGTDAMGFEQAISVAASMGESHFRTEVEENLKRLRPVACCSCACCRPNKKCWPSNDEAFA